MSEVWILLSWTNAVISVHETQELAEVAFGEWYQFAPDEDLDRQPQVVRFDVEVEA